MNIGLDDDSELICFANIEDGKQTSPQNNQETALVSPIKLIILKQNSVCMGKLECLVPLGTPKERMGRC